MDRTLFAGLTRLEPGESLQTDGASFQAINPPKIDRLLEVGAVTHRHNAAPAQVDPIVEPGASAVASGGFIPGGLALYFGYTLRDFDNGETIISPLATVTTEDPLEPPMLPPSAVVDYTAGALLTDTYYYAVSLTDAAGGETPIGEAVQVEREPGFASGQVTISGLADIVDESEAAGWRLWRAVGGGDFFLIALGTDDTYVDTGIESIDASLEPLDDSENFTNADNSVWVVVPESDELATASAFSLYMSEQADFDGPSLVGTYPIASAGVPIWVRDLSVGDERPPDISTCVRGASQIDPDTEILDWPWRRPVATHADLPATDEREIRLVIDEHRIWTASAGATGPGDWELLYPSDTLNHLEDGFGDSYTDIFDTLRFIGSGGAVVTVDNPASQTGEVAVWAPEGTVHEVLASGSAAVEDPAAIVFVGSGTTEVSVEDGGGSAIVRIFSSAAAGGGGGAWTPRGEWDSGTAYSTDDIVEFHGSTFLALVDIAAGGDDPWTDQPTTGGENWQVIAEGVYGAGPWDSGTTYYRGAVVSSVGGAWLLTSAVSLGDPPEASESWTALGAAVRHDDNFTAAGLASGAAATSDVTLHHGWQLLRVQASRACRVRAYPTAAYRTADAGRAIGTDPTGDHGLLLELLLPTGDLDFAMAPPVDGYNLDSPVVNTAYFAVTNMGAVGDVTVTLTVIQTE